MITIIHVTVIIGDPARLWISDDLYWGDVTKKNDKVFQLPLEFKNEVL
jgi:hypothetical protein